VVTVLSRSVVDDPVGGGDPPTGSAPTQGTSTRQALASAVATAVSTLGSPSIS
jgi:hypothetical protein